MEPQKSPADDSLNRDTSADMPASQNLSTNEAQGLNPSADENLSQVASVGQPTVEPLDEVDSANNNLTQKAASEAPALDSTITSDISESPKISTSAKSAPTSIKNTQSPDSPSTKKHKLSKKQKIALAAGCAVVAIAVVAGVVVACLNSQSEKQEIATTEETPQAEEKYTITGNGLSDFDFQVLKSDNSADATNSGKNIAYSPLSIKYALEMLAEGAEDNAKTEITDILGTYTAKKYLNSANLSLANAIFIKDSMKSLVKSDYVNTINSKYNAQVIYDSFASTANLNSWVKKQTFGLVDNLLEKYNDNSIFALVNALAIDMDWKKMIQQDSSNGEMPYSVRYEHEAYSQSVSILYSNGYTKTDFEGQSAKSVQLAAVANNYDIVSTLGEDQIKETLRSEYAKYLEDEQESKTKAEQEGRSYEIETIDDFESYMDEYIAALKQNYQQKSSSTDFSFYTDDYVKAFAKDLKEYDGTTLQYVAIMPKEGKLTDYIDQLGATEVNNIIDGLASIDTAKLKEGVITEVKGNIPEFNFDYQVNLVNDLQKLGVNEIFNQKGHSLSGIIDTTDPTFVNQAVHKTQISFTNYGIKAAAATAVDGGLGSAGGGFYYDFDVPVETIDLTFDHPYIFLIRDKVSGEVWFAGAVYNPSECEQNECNG